MGNFVSFKENEKKGLCFFRENKTFYDEWLIPGVTGLRTENRERRLVSNTVDAIL